jgi:hypothetical protein
MLFVALFAYTTKPQGLHFPLADALIFLAAAERPEELVVGIFYVEKHLK